MDSGNRKTKFWASEFAEFCNYPPVDPPPDFSADLKARVKHALCLAPWLVFAKLFLIASTGGALSLLICPQFGLEHGGYQNSISRFYMSFGHHVCVAACGATFLACSLALAILLLRNSELKIVRRHQFLHIPAVAFIFLSLLVCSGETVLLESALLWFGGGIVAGLSTLNIGWLVKSFLQTRFVLP